MSAFRAFWSVLYGGCGERIPCRGMDGVDVDCTRGLPLFFSTSICQWICAEDKPGSVLPQVLVLDDGKISSSFGCRYQLIVTLIVHNGVWGTSLKYSAFVLSNAVMISTIYQPTHRLYMHSNISPIPIYKSDTLANTTSRRSQARCNMTSRESSTLSIIPQARFQSAQIEDFHCRRRRARLCVIGESSLACYETQLMTSIRDFSTAFREPSFQPEHLRYMLGNTSSH